MKIYPIAKNISQIRFKSLPIIECSWKKLIKDIEFLAKFMKFR